MGGNHGCPPCGPDGIQTEGRSKFLNKVIYMGARRFLHMGNELRKRRYDKHWVNKRETRIAPVRPTGRFWRAQWTRVQAGSLPIKKSGMNTLSCFYRLPYFQVSGFNLPFDLFWY